jgi:penicillin-insensitive murein endopeptidase
MRLLAVLAAAVALLSAAFLTDPARARDRETDATSRSIGWPWRGTLSGGRALRDSSHLRLLDVHRENGRFWAASSLASLIERAARRVAERHPGAKLPIGEASQRGGGNIHGHRSHENGLDADIGFYLRDESGTFVVPPQFVAINGRSGLGRLGETRFTFDDNANFTLVEALLTDRETPVQHLFLSRPLSRRMIAIARRRAASPQLIERLRLMLMQPGSGPRAHREHIHVRVYCPPSDRPECRDRGPYWYWLPPELTPNPAMFQELIAEGVRGVPLMPYPESD